LYKGGITDAGSIKGKALEELSIRFVDDLPDEDCANNTKDQGIYDLCGYLLRSRGDIILQCADCKNLLETDCDSLPQNFLAAEYTASRSYGGLKFPSVAMFKSFKEAERIISQHFQSPSHIFVHKTFEEVMDKICELNLINLGCESHPDVLPFLLMEFVQIRYYFESRRYRQIHLSNVTTTVHSNMKKARVS